MTDERRIEHLQDFNAEARDALAAILRAWDENDVLPTRLIAALANAKKVMGHA